MKWLINYDFFNAIRDVNQPLSLSKEFRHTSSKFYLFMAAYSAGVIYSGADTVATLLGWAAGQVIGMESICLFKRSLKNKNPDYIEEYAREASERLKKLAVMLQDINVKTDYEMLLKSELYEKKYKIESNDDKLLTLKEEKYIYVPSYGFDGKEKETSILQEHDIGSHSYMLSVGEPEKQYRRVLVNNHA